jgi:hypothetical protein
MILASNIYQNYINSVDVPEQGIDTVSVNKLSMLALKLFS